MKDENNMKAKHYISLRKKNNWLLVLVPVLVFIGIIVVATAYWKFGSFERPNTISADTYKAELTLIGALVGSIVSFCGLLLKYSIDSRSADIQERADSRADKEQQWKKETQEIELKRLNIDAAVRSVALLSSSSGGEVPKSQRAGALFALIDLGMYELSLALCEQMLADKKLDSLSACWLINKALKYQNNKENEENDIQQQAAIIYRKFVEQMLEPHGNAVCPSILVNNKIANLNDKSLIESVYALIDLVLYRARIDWNENVLLYILSSLRFVWKNESIKEEIREVAGIGLNRLTRHYNAEETLYWQTDNQEGYEAQKTEEFLQQVAKYSSVLLNGKMSNGMSREKAAKKWSE